MNNKINIPMTPAAVLVPILNYADAKTLLFTVRSPQVIHYKSQISFPGGCQNTKDACLITTALRETQEEIGLSPQATTVLEVLPPYTHLPGFIITPVIGLVTPPPFYHLDEREVSHVFEVPLNYALNKHNYRTETTVFNGKKIKFDVLKYQQYRIWGATASITRSLCEAQSLLDHVSDSIAIYC